MLLSLDEKITMLAANQEIPANRMAAQHGAMGDASHAPNMDNELM
jgi:hypothetical protein